MTNERVVICAAFSAFFIAGAMPGFLSAQCTLIVQSPEASGVPTQYLPYPNREACDADKARGEAEMAIRGGVSYSCTCSEAASPSGPAQQNSDIKAEGQRRLAEQKKKEEERLKQEEFERKKQAALRELKGLPVPNAGELKGLDPERDELRMQKNTAAWQQRTCAAELTDRVKKAVKNSNGPIDMNRLLLLKKHALDVLQGKNLKVECKIKQMLNLGIYQPDNAGWVERYEAELDNFIYEAKKANSEYEKKAKKPKIAAESETAADKQKAIARKIAAMGPPPERGCWKADSACMTKRDSYFKQLWELNEQMTKLTSPMKSALQDDKTLRHISAILGQKAPVPPGLAASEAEKKKYQEDLQKYDDSIKKALQDLMRLSDAPLKGFKVKEPPAARSQ